MSSKTISKTWLKIGDLSSNYLSNKIKIISQNKIAFKEVVLSENDFCLIFETEIDYSILNPQFSVNVFKFLYKGRNRNGGGLIIFARVKIPFKLVN